MTNVTSSLREALRDHYPPPEWAMAFEVQFPRDEGGLRFADAVATRTRKNLVEVHGFEVKVSRSDWLTELADPSKAAPARSLCDYWWLVLGSSDIVEEAEVPKGVGVLIPTPNGSGLGVFLHPARNLPLPQLDRGLIGAFLRRLDPLEPATYWAMRERRAEQRGISKGRNEAGRIQRARLRRHVGEPDVPEGERFCP